MPLAGFNFATEITPKLTGGFMTQLDFDAAFAGDQPGAAKEFPGLSGVFEASLKTNADDGSLGPLTVSINDVTLDVGQFFSQFITPFINDLRTATKFMEPIVNLLDTPIPIISPLYKAITGNDLKLIDFVDSGNDVEPFLNLIQFINNGSPIPSGNGTINLGSFTIVGGQPMQNPKPADSTDELDSADQSYLDSLSGDNLKFPLLDDPTTAIQLLLGQMTDSKGNPIDLVTYPIPNLNITFPFPGLNIPIWPVPPIEVALTPKIDFQTGGTVGLDTSGFATGNPIDGFFLQKEPSTAIPAWLARMSSLTPTRT